MLNTKPHRGGLDYIPGLDFHLDQRPASEPPPTHAAPPPSPPSSASMSTPPAPEAPRAVPMPTSADQRSRNPLRPTNLDDMIGQARLRSMLRRIIASSKDSGKPMAHTLLVGASGTGKSTIANIIGNELGVGVYVVQAPVSHDTLLDHREVMKDGDILFIDEVHQQAIMERRGKTSATQPEVLFNVMEDRTLVTSTGILSFPAITVIAATTDEGMLPDPFINRFPLRPVIEPYSEDDMLSLAYANAVMLDTRIDLEAARKFARASRRTPRVLNNYMRNALDLAVGEDISAVLAEEVLFDLNGVTEDGLTRDMQNVLTFLLTRARRENQATGVVTYQASVATIATAIGKSRDQKAVQLRIEPYLIECGFLQVGHGGRCLTDEGMRRALQLLSHQ